MQTRFKTQYNGLHKPQLESNTEESMTVPDDSYTIKELIARHQNMPPIGKNMVYSEGKTVENYIDIVQVQEAAWEAQKVIEQYNSQEEKKKFEKTKLAREQYKQKLKEELKKELENQ